MTITGKFTVKLTPVESTMEGRDNIALGRMTIDKEFEGDLAGKSWGEMLSAMTTVKGSAGYVAIEQFNGSLRGKNGSFVLQHYGVMDKGSDRLVLEVVPDSGGGELAGISGSMVIRIEEGAHFYDFDYSLPD